MLRSSKEWQWWGERDPFWAAATRPGRERGGRDPWTAAEFFESGRVLWEEYRSLWERYGLNRGVAVDIGCGPGRFTKQLAGEFEEVIGVDVSEAMLNTARELVDNRNVRFVLADGLSFPVESESADGVFSLLVLLHLDGKRAVSNVIHETARVLRDGGSAFLQIPIVVWPGDGVATGGHAQIHASRALWRRARSILRSWLGKPIMQWHDYDARWLFQECEQAGLADPCIAVVPHRAQVRSFLMVRKPA